jgi:tetratricopeptide (TPR) repeat protein
MSGPNEPKRPGRNSESSDQDLESDALLDSLLFDELPAPTPPPAPTPLKLHQPQRREYSEDDVTVVGRTEDLLASLAREDDGTSGLEDLAGSDIDQLLSSMPAGPAEAETGPPPAASVPRLPDVPPAPRVPVVPAPRPASRLPGSVIPRAAVDATTRPPAVNPAGPPARQPFPPAVSPRAPQVAPTGQRPLNPRLQPGAEEEDERTRIFSHQEALEEVESAGPELPNEPFRDPRAASLDPRSSMKTLHQVDDQNSMPTVSAPQPSTPVDMPSIPGPQNLPTALGRAPSFDRYADSQPPLSAEAIDQLEEVRLSDASELQQLSDVDELRPASEPPFTSVRPSFNPSFRPSPIPVPPSPVPSSLPPSIWPDERPAQDHLGGQHEAWVTRAEWLENEAQATSDPQAKARTLIVASEIWALVGQLPRAREVAALASAIPRAQPMAARQLRALAAADGDYKAVAPALEMEIRSAPTVDARVHAAYFSAEVHRLTLQDEASAKKKLDLAVRAQQDDPRAHIAKLAELLGKSNAPARVRWPESESLSELARASDELLRLRGAPPVAGSVAQASGARAAFEDARRALSAGEREKAADAIEKLAQVDGLKQASAWLAASLLGADPKTRGRAITSLRELATRQDSPLARRTLVTRSLEHGDDEGVREAVLGARAADTFSPQERLALAALNGLSPSGLEETVRAVAEDAELRPLAAAFVTASSNSALDVRTGSEAARAEQRLGQTLGTPPADATDLSYLRPHADAFASTHAMSPLARLLTLEFAKVARAKGMVAIALGDWPFAADDAEAERDRRMAAALVHELAGEHGSATVMYRRALHLDASNEAALRALSHAAPGEASELLVALASELGPSPRAALSLLEAALRDGNEDGERYQSLVERAKVAAPELPLSHRLSEIAARRAGDAARLLSALRARREASDDANEQALDLVREALLVAESDLPLAEQLLAEAERARPNDLALRELSERMVPSDEQERAAWREALAATSEGKSRGRLLAEAALERGRAGDLEAASRNAYLALESDGTDLWRVAAERYAASGPAAARISDALLQRARASSDPREQRQLYEHLSQLDLARGDSSSALLWQSAILEQSPEHLPALRRLEHAYISGDRPDDLEPIAASLARVLDVGESNAHARLATRLRVLRGAWSGAREMAAIAVSQAPDELWALRALSAQARAAEDNELGLRVDERLFSLAERPLDKATLALRAAEAAARLERPEDTKRLLSAALEQVPDHLLALTTLSEVLEGMEEYAAAAEAQETLAEASHVEAHQVSAWHQAGVLWLDKASNVVRGRAALERAVAMDVGHEDAVVRLQSLYVSGNERQRLAELLERRLQRTTDPEERIALEVTRGRALAEVGEKDAAKAALSAALDANPDHAEALEAFAELCLSEGDWTSGEQALIRLARHTIELPRQAQIYRRLGELYDTTLPNPERAELAYKEVLKRDPDDPETVRRLVQVYGRLGDKATALTLQADLLGRAKTPDEKRERTLALALCEEQIGGDRRRAEATFEKARKEWPHDSSVLRALAEFQQRHGETRAMQMLLDRAATDARRALGTGRFEPGFFEVLATVAELKSAGDSALVARATLAALHGEEVPVPAAGPIAGDPRLDELLAPELVSPPLRALLQKCGAVLDAAYPVDLKLMRAQPLPAASLAFTSYVQQVASSFGIRGLEVYSSATLGAVCIPVNSGTPQLVFGQTLLDSDDEAARYFLMIRCLKILQAQAATLSRTAPIDLWPVLAAFLGTFAPTWIPQGVEGKKLSDAQRRIQSVVPEKLEDDVPALALEVIGAIGNRASLLGTALHQWGNRTALLSAGSLVASLRGVSFAVGQPGGPPKEGPERVKWIVRNPEARDLATYCVGEQYAEARARLGLNR